MSHINELTKQVIHKAAELAYQDRCEVITIDHFLMAVFNADLMYSQFMKVDGGDKVHNAISNSFVNIKQMYLDKSEYDDFDEYEDDYEDPSELEHSSQISVLIGLTKSYLVSNGRDDTSCDVVDLFKVALIGYNSEDKLFSDSAVMQIFSRLDEVVKKVVHDALNNSEDASETKKKEGKFDFLINLNEEVKSGAIETVIGRAKEIHQVTETLARKRKPNVMLIGEAGTGKTAIAEGIALSIVNEECHETLADYTVYSLDITAMLAGTKFRGEFEERAKEVLTFLKEQEKVILFIDEFHTAVGAGGTNQSSADLSNFLKPYLARGAFRCIAATTNEEYRSDIEKNKALTRRFTNIRINETDRESTLEIMRGIAPSFEEHHGITYGEDTMELMFDLADRYIQNRHFPDKAIDIMDDTIAFARVNEKPAVDADVVYSVISKMANVPVEVMRTTKEDNSYKDLNANIKASLFGQDHVVDIVTNQLLIAKSGLGDENKPMGSFLFSGTSGTGKTELARQIANNLDLELIKFDMSEYQESHTVSKLIGAPAGYAGYDENSAGLVDAIEKSPNSVLLLDEVEKAHPKVMDLLLQIMDDAKLTSSQGKTVSFRNVVVLMTSNLGAQQNNSGGVGYMGMMSKRDNSAVNEAITRHFRPEFINRLDGTGVFNNLTKDVVLMIVDKELKLLEDRLAKQGFGLTVSKTARTLIAKDGFDEAMGARPIKRYIANNIKQVIATKIVMENIEGGKFSVRVKAEGAIEVIHQK